MAGVLEQLIGPQKRAVVHRTSRMNPKALELHVAKEILAEIFHARPGDVEEMIHSRMEERSRHQECEEGLWPATFCLGE
jgi:hypothetical protein